MNEFSPDPDDADESEPLPPDIDSMRVLETIKVECTESDIVEGMIKISVLEHPQFTEAHAAEPILLYPNHGHIENDGFFVTAQQTVVEFVLAAVQEGIDVSTDAFRETMTRTLEEATNIHEKLAILGFIRPEDLLE